MDLGIRATESPELNYQRMRQAIRHMVEKKVRPGSTVLVVSNGDGALLDLPGSRALHFPQGERGAYAGHHPADGADAIKHLEDMRARGATHMLIPRPSLWWLNHYAELARHLDSSARRVDDETDACALYELRPVALEQA
jgi:hypothetical protein